MRGSAVLSATAILLLAAAQEPPEDAEETACAAGGEEQCRPPQAAPERKLASASSKQHEYFWPGARGWPQHGAAAHAFGGWPCNLSSQLAWSWAPPEGQAINSFVGAPLFDDELNIYLAVDFGIWKLTPNGEVIWTWAVPNFSATRIFRKVPTLVDGVCCGSLTDGMLFGVDMSTGSLIWSRQAGNATGVDAGFVVGRDGVVLMNMGEALPGGNQDNWVLALNASNGESLWTFEPDVGVWNFLPSFVGDGTVVFQDWDAGVYRVNLTTGELLWRNGGTGGTTWTDGGATLGPNMILYSVGGSAGVLESFLGRPGFLRAHRVSDGELQWEIALEQTPYTWPAVGHLREGAPLSVVTGVGSLMFIPLKLQLFIFFAGIFATGWLPGMFAGLCCWRCRKGSHCCCICKGGAAGLLLWACLVIPLIAMGRLGPWMKTGWPTSIQAFDAETGSLQWRYDLPPWDWFCAAGDEEYMLTRIWHKRTPLCLPPAMSYSTLDGQGIFHVGHGDGKLYRIQDRNGDGIIQEDVEVCTFDAGSGCTSSGPSIVPGMLAISTCDKFFLFKE